MKGLYIKDGYICQDIIIEEYIEGKLTPVGYKVEKYYVNLGNGRLDKILD